jgi:hypothetical protein
MSLAAVRPLFRSRLNGLGYTEHSDAFDDQNRPQTKLEKLYRLSSGPVTGTGANQQAHSFEYEIELVITYKGKGTNNVELADRVWTESAAILADVLSPEVRNGESIKDILPGAISVTENSASDDNDIILTMGFTALIICLF